MRTIRPFLVYESQKAIPVRSIISCCREYDGYTRINTTLRKEPFLTTLLPDEVMDMTYGGINNGW